MTTETLAIKGESLMKIGKMCRGLMSKSGYLLYDLLIPNFVWK
ncbi:protein of unknown function [Petrocella atlantisensis]|uniref:Uncharacterized protein n=1 Tax=Petrocella atlantisensis TaxID=2173034 RepID=A0A3P7S0X8_9FIRM|nr:protein of unknown function [Petrocella atlantisensis]